MAVALRAETARARSHLRALRSDASAILRALGLARCELSIMIVDNAAIAALNFAYRNRDRPTDVLSFSQLEQPGGCAPGPAAIADDAATILGDVVISIETALTQARTQGVTPRERLRTLLIHGILHLIGYDHERSPSDARRMFAREREIASRTAKPRGARRASKRRR
ncbi:MAG TPA: rRNA maturation RNase YbeY [Candidatus Binataceae bacterium]|nr:rRNA maturation RNase YbeY [Candidatus Binataceae bacterium]